MKIEELRIGSMVWSEQFSNNGEIYTIRSISADRVHDAQIVDPDGYGVEVPFSDLKPVPIDSKILELLGFSFVSDWTIDGDDGLCYVLQVADMKIAQGMMGNTVTLLDSKNVSTGVNLDYVHEVQNLIIALACKPLELKR